MEIHIRKFPYPYKAMFAICSDLDETPDKETYFEISRYLNTEQKTSMGTGVGLEVGNTIYFDMPEDQFSYGNTDDDGKDKIAKLIKSGHIDCLHSYGDFVIARERAESIQKDLQGRGCEVAVWVDHAIAPSNFGADIMMGQGDVIGSSVYHADLTFRRGVKYVWMGRVTSVTGQATKRRLFAIFNKQHPFASCKTLFKEVAKIILGTMGVEKYVLHRNNELCRNTRLRDGRVVTEFIRTNPFWGGVDKSETAYGLHNVLTEQYLRNLVKSNGYSILYTHLGKVKNKSEPFEAKARAGLTRLADYFKAGEILVTTTRRLLDYHSMVNNIKVCSVHNGETTEIKLSGNCSLNELSGLTFYTDSGNTEYKVKFNDEYIQCFSLNETDETGRRSISINWNRLEYPL
jgi:hypothetical protein